MAFGVFFSFTKYLEPGGSGMIYWFKFIFSHTTKSDFFASWCQSNFFQTGSESPSFVEYQYSLFHSIGYCVGFPVLVHARTHREQTRMFAVLRPQDIFIFVDAEVTPQFRHFASTLPGLGIDDTMSLPYSITCSDEIKTGNAPVPCQFLYCFIMLALHEQASFRKRT